MKLEDVKLEGGTSFQRESDSNEARTRLWNTQEKGCEHCQQYSELCLTVGISRPRRAAKSGVRRFLRSLGGGGGGGSFELKAPWPALERLVERRAGGGQLSARLKFE